MLDNKKYRFVAPDYEVYITRGTVESATQLYVYTVEECIEVNGIRIEHLFRSESNTKPC